MDVDLILLSRDLSPVRPDVLEGIQTQRDVKLTLHRVTGVARPDDHNRWETIARARNEARTIGVAPWAMLLDDDVVLAPDCISRLVTGLRQRPQFAALAADSAGEMNRAWEHWDYPSHVGMAAVLFRRERLAGVRFRWEDQMCECLCCCVDLRAAGLGIGYMPGALAWHRPMDQAPSAAAAPNPPCPAAAVPLRAAQSGQNRRPGQILTAFDRRDQQRFRTQFLATLRESGNDEHVWAVAYGLFPTELDRLRPQPGVTVLPIPSNGICPALRRLRDFQQVIAGWPEDTPVAYWDAGDVLFQSRIEPLWDLTASNPDTLLVTREAMSHPENPVIRTWSDCIEDRAARDRAFEVMSTHVFLNAGFAAGKARALMSYLRAGDRLLNSTALRGVGEWGDQAAMNLYCHTNPDRWREIDAGWNYALAGRNRDEFWITPEGRAHRRDAQSIRVLHGNAFTLRWLELSPWGPSARQGPTPPLVPMSG
jgi:hypothetical protein